MKKHLFRRGFTLIELLVVIAIIGILASVVLASLNSARSKGADAAIKSTINNQRAAAELFFDDAEPSTYEGFCASVADAETAVNNAGGTFNCADSDDGYTITSPMVTDSAEFYCVDSEGDALEIDAAVTDDAAWAAASHTCSVLGA